MTRFLASVVTAMLAISLIGGTTTANAETCTPTAFSRDGILLTAAKIDGATTSGLVDATGCDIGIYFPPGTSGTVNNATVSGARYYGIVADRAVVNVTNSTVRDIGNTPFDGSQHGVGIFYTNGASGLIDSNDVYAYQKGGIVIDGAGTKASVTNNTVTGLGPVDFIAQNGIQVSRGAVATVRGNDISNNDYTGHVGVGPNPGGQNPPGWEYYSAGLLLYQAGDGTKASMNHFSGNQHNHAQIP